MPACTNRSHGLVSPEYTNFHPTDHFHAQYNTLSSTRTVFNHNPERFIAVLHLLPAAIHRPKEEALVVTQTAAAETPAAAEEVAAEMAKGAAVVEAAAGRDKGKMTHADTEKPQIRKGWVGL